MFIYVANGAHKFRKLIFFNPRSVQSRVFSLSGCKLPEIKFIKDINEIKNMPKFDVIVGNPPYKKDLHLKFLKICNSLLKRNGEIIWIHPARWLQDPLAPMKGNSDFNKYKDLPFVNFEIIPCGIASKLFNNEMTSDLVISHLKKGEKSILTEDKIYELRGIPIHFKELLKSKFFSLKDVIEKDKRKGIRVRIRAIVPNTVHGRDHVKGRYDLLTKADKVIIDGIMDGQDWTKGPARNQFTKKEGSPLPLSIKFDTVQEAQNFIDSINTEFFLFFNYLTKLDVNVQFQYLPFMKDYREPWTNERFQRYFQVSDEEMKFIKDTMKKYINL